MITYQGAGDIFSYANTDRTMLCPINAVGTMGAGLALAMKKRGHNLHDVYQRHFSNRSPEEPRDRARCLIHHHDAYLGKVLLFCTKVDWRAGSPLWLVEENLRRLAVDYKRLGISSLAVPTLGGGLGNMPFEMVHALVHEHLGTQCPLDVHFITSYKPKKD